MPLDLIRLSRIGLQKLTKKPPIIPLETIPDEILDRILSFCMRSEILAVSFTCWRLSVIAKVTLYRDVKHINPSKVTSFFQSILLHEHLAAYVRKCELKLTFSQNLGASQKIRKVSSDVELGKKLTKLKPNVADSHHIYPRDPLLLAAAALKRMVNLCHLELLFPDKEIQTNYTSTLFGDCSFELRHFHTNLRFDIAMTKFLKAQKSLHDLYFYSSAYLSSLDMNILKDDFLPCLSSLGWSSRVPMELIRQLAKDRPIHTINIHLIGGLYDMSDLLGIGPETSLLIRTANFTFQDHRYSIYRQLELVNIHLPNLIGLGLAVVSFSQDLVNEVYVVLKQFNHLERLFLYDQRNEMKLSQETAITYAKSFWARCDTLRRIGFYCCEPFMMVEKLKTKKGKSKTVLWVVKRS